MFFRVLRALVAAFLKLVFRVRVSGEENIPENGGCIICANHVSNWDPIFLIALLKRRIYFMGKDELFHIFGLGAFLKSIGIIPVKRNSSDISAVKTAIKVLGEDKVLGIFPSGTRVKKGEPVQVKAGVAFIAVKAATPVVPVYIDSTYKLFGKAHIKVGVAEDFAVYGKAKLSSEKLSEISNNLFDRICELSEDKK